MTDASRLRAPRSVDDLFLYRLMRLASTARPLVVRLCERQFGITRREWSVLGILVQEGGLSPSTLAERALLDRARASRVIGSLVAKGLVDRSPLPGNRREVRLSPTDAGRTCYQVLLPQVAAINRGLLSVLDEAELQVLDRALQRLTDQASAMVAAAERADQA
jgi:DNA-binding MarR family transcriptional regulator